MSVDVRVSGPEARMRPTLHNSITSTVQYHYPLLSVGDKATAAQYALAESTGYLNYICFI
eukprot:scaffold187218_cov74-Cyclotella_meneghiniana.AAC.2